MTVILSRRSLLGLCVTGEFGSARLGSARVVLLTIDGRYRRLFATVLYWLFRLLYTLGRTAYHGSRGRHVSRQKLGCTTSLACFTRLQCEVNSLIWANKPIEWMLIGVVRLAKA